MKNWGSMTPYGNSENSWRTPLEILSKFIGHNGEAVRVQVAGKVIEALDFQWVALFPLGSGRYLGPSLMQLFENAIGRLESEVPLERKKAEEVGYAIAIFSRDFPHLVHNGLCFQDRFWVPSISANATIAKAIKLLKEYPNLKSTELALRL